CVYTTRAKKRAYITKESDYENLDKYIWSDKEIDERASNYFAESSGRPSTYARGYKRTLRQKKAELKKAVQNIQSITAYFASTFMYSNIVSASTSTCESSMALIKIESIEVEPMEAEPMEVEPIEAEPIDVELMDMELAELGLTEVELSEQKLPKDNHGKFTKVSSFIDDERISIKIISYLRSYKFSVNPKVLKKYAKNEVFPSLGIENKTTILQYRQTIFLPMMKELEPVLIKYDNKDLIKLVEKNILSEKKQHCLDFLLLIITIIGKHKIRPKGWGQCIHVSEFLCEPLGRVHLTEEQHASHPEIPKCYITELLEIGANYEAKQLEQAIDILEIALPDIILVFGFDNSSSHGAFTEDALAAS
ncbi:27963_t:CDS:2, partial [Gigaspora margarita]